MMNGLLIGGAALAALELGGGALARKAAGVVVPGYVTDAQRAAMASLDGAGIYGGDQANHRYLDFNRVRLGSNGTAPGKTHLAALSVDEAIDLCTAFLNACLAGVNEGGYQLAPDQPPMAVGLAWAFLETTDGRNLTPLGRAAAQVMARRRGLITGFLSSAADVLSANLAVGVLAIEMDDVGYLLTGAPDDPSIVGGLGAAAGAVGTFAADVAGGVASVAGQAVAGALFSPVGFVVLGGAAFLLWRAFR